MSADADIVRETMVGLIDISDRPLYSIEETQAKVDDALAALDALVAERDEARLREVAANDRMDEIWAEKQAAEAERDEALAAQKQTILEDGKVVSRVVAENKLLREALERIAEMYDGDIEVDGTESDAWVFARADDFVTAHGIARAALAAPTKEDTDD